MTPEVLAFPTDPDPCAATGCAMQGEPAEVCRDHRCPHRGEREAAEDRSRAREATKTVAPAKRQ
jgi:hypothetical protein